MSVNANITRMIRIFLVTIRTPNGFEVEQVEVRIPLHAVKIVDREFFLCVCKCAHLTEFARLGVIRVRLAEFRLILLWMIKVFHSVVRSWAAIAERTFVDIVAQR